MLRKKRTEILINGSSEVSVKLSQEILTVYEVKTLEEPNNSLVMVKVRESAKRSLFYLGEVLITECKVMIQGALGIGMVMGHKLELAYNLAIIDAAYNANCPETKEWTSVLLREGDRIKGNCEASQNKILKTKVNFDNMDVSKDG
ncbi:MAG TPA: phosphonate C-P lyase system protein PhnG [Desulfosporosinus sp.]|nr:phosphonate C-P lyase system protein PhnG [Desulfosporosinus sp.]